MPFARDQPEDGDSCPTATAFRFPCRGNSRSFLVNTNAMQYYCQTVVFVNIRTHIYRENASSGTPASSANSSSVNRNDPASMFSSRCSTEEVPGIGSVNGERCSNQASATCMGLAPCASATRWTVCCATLPAPSGNQGMNTILFCSQ